MNRNNDLMKSGDKPTTPGPPGASQVSDARSLPEKAREAMQSGAMPARAPDRMWGGRGDGCHCTVCGLPVKRDEAEIEMEFNRDGDDPGRDNFHVHVRCFAAWEFELDQMRLATPASRTGGPPESDTTVGRRPLPEALNGVRISDRECKTYKRGPA